MIPECYRKVPGASVLVLQDLYPLVTLGHAQEVALDIGLTLRGDSTGQLDFTGGPCVEEMKYHLYPFTQPSHLCTTYLQIQAPFGTCTVFTFLFTCSSKLKDNNDHYTVFLCIYSMSIYWDFNVY